MSKDEGFQKIGSGHAAAMGRQGLNELRGALYPESNVAQPPEYGLYGKSTPGEVAESRRNEEPEVEKGGERKSILGERMKEAEGRGVHGRDDKGLDREV